MAKDGTSPKLKRVGRKPSKGIAHRHNPKPKSTLENTGLLNDLANRSYYPYFPRTASTSLSSGAAKSNLEEAKKYLLGKLGERVTAMVKRENWQPAVRPLVCDYIKSLVMGDGSKPAELSSDAARRIQTIFVELSSRIIVGDDTLPAQRQEWYEPALKKYRNKRSKQRSKRPSPMSVPRQRVLQPTG